MHSKTFDDRRLPLEMIKNNLKLELKDCHIHYELLYVNERLYISNISELRTKIIRDIYDIPLEGHAGRLSIYDRLNKHYYWPRMIDSITHYVKSYHIYKRSKTYKEGKQGLFKPLPIPKRY